MLDLLLAALVFPLLVAAGLAALASVTLLPFVLALQLAGARGFAPVRWGALALLGSLAGLAVMAYVATRPGVSSVRALVGVPVAYAAPLALWLLEPGSRVGGRAGAHE